MIDFERAERATEFIRDHAERYGYLVGRCKALEQQRKVVYGLAFHGAEAGTVAERESIAHSSPEFRAVVEEIEDAWADKTAIETQIKAAELTVELWRSVNASRNRTDRAHR